MNSMTKDRSFITRCLTFFWVIGSQVKVELKKQTTMPIILSMSKMAWEQCCILTQFEDGARFNKTYSR